MKHVARLICGGIIFALGIICLSSAYAFPSVIPDVNETDLFYDGTDFNAANVDYDLREDLGEDFFAELDRVGPDSRVEFDLVTGEIDVVKNTWEKDAKVESTKPYIPKDVEVAENFVSPMSIDSNFTTAQVEYPSVNKFPYCTNVFLELTYRNGEKCLGSGVFVGNKTILTAGHALYDSQNGYVSQVRVTPGGVLSDFKTVTATRFTVAGPWASGFNREYDYGVLAIGTSLDTGYLGMSKKTDSQLRNLGLLGVYSYPGDKERGTLWYSSGKTIAVEPNLFSYNANTFKGSSGGSVVDMADFHNIIGVHVARTGDDGTGDGVAVRITDNVIRTVQAFEQG